MCGIDDLDLFDPLPDETINNIEVNFNNIDANKEDYQNNNDLPSGLELRNELRDILWK